MAPMKPTDIETLSFRIIDEEAGPHTYTDQEWSVIRRMIHTSADFEYMQTTRIHPRAIEAGIDAIRKGRNIVTDTNMARAGIRKAEIYGFGGSVECLIDEGTVAQVARDSGCTRAKAAVDAAVPLMKGGIYVVGNAPTALLRLIELIRSGKAEPVLVVGLPVGFVNAAESKSELTRIERPHITNTGRKGGSNVAASVVNALAIMAAG
jgi:precorrin-8X/cobalt-precorrin-8 methylmutase